MAANAYLDRLSQLEGQKAEKLSRGLPLNRPMTEQPMNAQPAGMAGNPKPKQHDETAGFDMDSMFGRSLESYKGQDKRFGQMTEDYTQLVSGLKQQVDAGMMPEVIAKQKMQQFLSDGRKHFSTNKASPMDNPQVEAALDAMFGGAQAGEQAAMAEAGMAPEGGPQGGMPNA